MFEYITQIAFLLGVLFIYMLSGSVMFSAVGEGYKATPLRCFAVGVGIWVLLVILSTIFLPVNIEILWYIFVALTLIGLFFLPKQDQDETLDKVFFYQVLVSFIILIPVLIFLQHDKLHLWQEFAIYAKGLFVLQEQGVVTSQLLSMPLSYQLAILPVGYFTPIQYNIFACFNLAILAFVACEFVRSSGVKIKVNNVLFPLVVSFALITVANPFSIKDLTLSADPFIFVCAIGFAFAEYIFRKGHLPQNIAAIPPAIILLLLSLSSTQGFLLAASLFIVFILRAIIQSSKLNHKQIIGVLFTPLLPITVLLFWQFYLNKHGLGFLFFDVEKVSGENINLVYKAIVVLAKQHAIEFGYICLVMLLALYSFRRVKTADDIVVDKYLLHSVFWIVAVYLLICVPVFFSQYQYVARASYSLGFTTICLVQFIILMPIGRFIKEKLDKLDIEISTTIKLTLITAGVIMVVMNKDVLSKHQNTRVSNMLDVSSYISTNIEQNSKIAVLDIKKTAKLYEYILSLKNSANYKFETVNYKQLPKGIADTHKYLQTKGFNYIFMHAPNNMLVEKFEYNLNPKYSYLYKITDVGFILEQKFDNKTYKDTNIIIK